ncbi:MAG: hypothetical protein AAB676_15615, partial [Verrucomicrobiota bacterium]
EKQRRGKPSLPFASASCYDDIMKISDDYHAKVRLWGRQPTVVSLPPGPPLPKFTSRKFHTHEEMNRWKQTLLREIAQTAARHG